MAAAAAAPREGAPLYQFNTLGPFGWIGDEVR
jgi:hypothetical protein